MTWQLGIVTDRAGYVHLGAIVAGNTPDAAEYYELLAPVGADALDKNSYRELTTVLVMATSSATCSDWWSGVSTTSGCTIDCSS